MKGSKAMSKAVGIKDEPVVPGGTDNLDINIHTEALIDFITETSTPITVGIQGEWGSGKTSLINAIYHSFESNVECKQIWINSWEYSLLSTPEESLLKIINRIIDELIEADKNQKRKEKIQDGAKKIFQGALRVGAQLTLGNEAANVAGELLSSGEASIGALREQLKEIVEEIERRSSNPYKKIIIYVDDLDRIEPKNAVAILELLKNIFSVPNCVFVLAIDYQVVVKGLEHKFGKQTAENEWEFRAFFDKIIQLPFMMPMGQYNIGKYVNSLLVDIGFVEGEGLDDGDVREIILQTIGGNPRSIKRLANSVSLIQLFIRKRKNLDKDNDDEDVNEQVNERTEKFLMFSLLCLQIAYPAIYSLLTQQPNFASWDDEFAFKQTNRSEERLGELKPEEMKQIFDQEFEAAKLTDDFNEEWEQALYRICYSKPRLKPRVTDISKFFSYLKDELLAEHANDLGSIIANVLSQTSVTSVESTDSGQSQTPLKEQRGKPNKAIAVVYDELKKLDINSDFVLRTYEGDWISYVHKSVKRGIRNYHYQIVSRDIGEDFEKRIDDINGGWTTSDLYPRSKDNPKIYVIFLLFQKKWIKEESKRDQILEEINSASVLNKGKFKFGKWYRDEINRIFIHVEITKFEHAAKTLVELMEISHPIIDRER